MGVGGFWVLVIFLWFCFQIQVLNSQKGSCNPNDLKALQGFLNGLDSGIPGWSSNSSTDCCDWVGVRCEEVRSSTSSEERVVKLDLGNRKLKGKLSEDLAGLDHLQSLNLSNNLLRGTLPPKLFHLQSLRELDLSYNDLYGLMPVDIDLPFLNVLDLCGNSLKGDIATGICKTATQIQSIDLSMNYFNGSIPAGFGNCSSLQNLSLSSNYLSGSLPNDLFSLQKLSRLYLQENILSGSLSDGIGKLSNLVELDISMNGFSGPLPDVFNKLGQLQRFSVHSNNFNGSLPDSLTKSPSLNLLNLRNNSLRGPISFNCSFMVNLASLDLASNRFQGPLPDSLSSCKTLRNVNLARNNFTGQIPESFRNLEALTYLSLSNTSLSNIAAALEILQHCKSLTTLVLTRNFRGEELPGDMSLNFSGLRALVIASCSLTGSIPTWVRSSGNLQLLDLSWNRLHGTIPNWLGELKFLFYLDLSNNTLSGEIPESLTNLESLISRNISLEELSPDFPFFMKRNQSTRALQYNQILSFPPLLDLSYNNLTGPIWPEFGKLKKLHVLDLKWNNLSGSIPSELSMMSSLETLDLSHNNLSGIIPPSLVNLSFLSKFSVSFNHLSGKIPLEGQFLTFPNTSFEGNPGLCGEHYSPCHDDGSNQIPLASPGKQKLNKASIIGMSIGIAFGTIFLLTLMFLIMIRTHGRRNEDPEKEDIDAKNKDLEQLGSKLVVLFQDKDNNKELSIDDLLKSTNHFDQANIIGCGGFGLVYKATLPYGKKVAIKRLSGDCGQMDREFQAEVQTLSRAQHGNLVLLQGYCIYGNDRLLIYSYMENGSLDYWLHEKIDGASSLDWETRLRIAQGAARGLAYLHQSCEPHILHRDIKSSNILLDENFEAHLADFGLARLIFAQDTHVSTDLVGTLGYIPPEYGQASVATYKGDVYSFGVVLLELLTGKRPMDMCKPKGCRDLISWVLQMKKEKRETEIFDPFIYDKENDKEMLRVLEIACLCLNETPKARPSTEQIVSWLDDINLDG
ncbi:PREDICTED: phytosulfokine receptor 1 [Nelumbo nucifera]|uniref:non-specific serine/threonine protein kinase n=1 Tax=Nelumbo nucifera TaxID=4432 RepID=A0A1U7ZCJ3_NELNU|nr:PREDICTED: phytosulfokine receptor 1 [Nelumbo nucifera]